MRAVITGGSSGIGFATAQVLGREGYEIIVVSFDAGSEKVVSKEAAIADVSRLLRSIVILLVLWLLSGVPLGVSRSILSVPYGDILCASCTPIFALLTKGYHCGGHYQTFY